MTLLSIVIPHHNRPEMLSSLLRSIPSRDDIQVIVVDDHSDRGPDQAEFPGVTFLDQPPGRKFAGAARNTGLEYAQGRWIFFADSDDLFVTSELARMLDLLANCDADMIVTKPSSFGADGKPGTRHRGFAALVDEALAGNIDALLHFYAPWAKFIRRELIDRHDLCFEDVRVSNDVMFSARTHISAQEILVADRCLYAVREGHASLTSRPTTEALRERLDVLTRLNALLRSSGKADYQVPAIGQLLTLARISPWQAFKAAIRARATGNPILVTRRHLIKHVMALKGRRAHA